VKREKQRKQNTKILTTISNLKPGNMVPNETLAFTKQAISWPARQLSTFKARRFTEEFVTYEYITQAHSRPICVYKSVSLSDCGLLGCGIVESFYL
jgi:hypothetical protein